MCNERKQKAKIRLLRYFAKDESGVPLFTNSYLTVVNRVSLSQWVVQINHVMVYYPFTGKQQDFTDLKSGTSGQICR